MSKTMIVNAMAAEETRIAIMEDGRLTELDFESGARTKNKGNIYKGIISNVEDGLEAAFIDFGEEKQGFLALSEVRKDLYPEKLKARFGDRKNKAKISEIFEIGQEVVVQISKDEIGSKGAAVSTYLSLPGRYVVLMHSDDSGGGISKKIQDSKARQRAQDMLSRIKVPEGQAVIIRTAGMNRQLPDLFRDMIALTKTWQRIDKGASLGRAPTILYREPDLIARTVRDSLGAGIAKIVVDSKHEYEEALQYFEERIPDAVSLLELHKKRKPIFESFGIEAELEKLFKREVRLPSGGSISIDPTEALVAVDVNSGKSNKEEDHEATVYKTNLEAAAEVGRQLRLRDLGGIVVIDFIDMASRRHIRDVEKAVRDAMRADRARIKVGRISENGTLELTRQRIKQAHRLVSFAPCPACSGTGIVRDPEGLALKALRDLKGRLARAKKSLAKVTLWVGVDVANVLNNQKRKEILNISEEYECEIFVLADIELRHGKTRIEEEKQGKAGLDAAKRANKTRAHHRHRRDPRTLPVNDNITIGAAPTFVDSEEVLLDGDKLHAALELSKITKMESGDAELEEHFENPLEEALFGWAPLGTVKSFVSPTFIERSVEHNPEKVVADSDDQAEKLLEGNEPVLHGENNALNGEKDTTLKDDGAVLSPKSTPAKNKSRRTRRPKGKIGAEVDNGASAQNAESAEPSAQA